MILDQIPISHGLLPINIFPREFTPRFSKTALALLLVRLSKLKFMITSDDLSPPAYVSSRPARYTRILDVLIFRRFGTNFLPFG